MAVTLLIPHSIRPQSGTLFLGVGNGSGTSLTNLYKMGSSGAQVVDIRARADTDSGSDARVLYARLHQYGAGGGEAVRAYAFANASGVATGGTLNGIHASVSVAASSTISGQAFGARLTYEAASESRTLNGNCAPVLIESNIGASNTVPATMAHIRVTDTGSVPIKKLFRLPTVASAGLLAAHTTDAMSHSIRCVDDAGTVFYIMATTTSSNRTGGA